ncbi:gp58-like family protein [Streptococcus dysgalactiae]|uniref:gp58-like family protein n=1 Tax=Streptococcus dysgalactiae TaxID=1334 RepID=UPI0010ECC98A|nr:gp58-like family protein [Streptococcus dysgalactiae]VTS49026.1 phage protein [Streptococcus dysgalactiae subsp. equisimilis]VTS49990.1 phage protein [Streptococcus dysgalactiae subsp. equisimilis]
MSRDPTLILDESNLVIGSDGRMHYTFTADDDNQKVRLASNCLGTAHFNQVMIERGDKATGYVAPVVVEGSGESTGVFKSLEEMLSGLQSINLELTDTKNSNLWSKIKLTTNGMLREYHRDNITTEIIEKADGIATRISEDTDKKLALINDTIDGIRREYQDADRKLSASYQAGIEGLKATMRDDKLGLQAEIKASASGIVRQFENQMTGLQSSVAQTSDKIAQEIRNRTGAVSQIQSTVDSYVRRLRDAEGNYNSLAETVAGYERRISNQDNTISSNFTQLKDLINQSVTLDKIQSLLRLSGDSIMLAIKDKIPQSKMSGSEIISAINLNAYGAVIAGKNIALDGNTTVNGTFTTKIAEAIKIRADQIIAGTIDAAKIRVINLNASSIVGLDADFIKARIGYAIVDMLEGKVIRARNGAMLIDLNAAKMDFNSNAEIVFNSTSNILYRQKMTNSYRYGNRNNIGALIFKDGYEGGVQVTLGVVSDKTIAQVKSGAVDWNDDGGYAGIRIRRIAPYSDADGVEIIGDRIIFRHTTKTHVSGTLYWQNTGWLGNWNLGRILQVISNKFRDHGWGAIGDIYNLEAAQDIKPNEYF